MSPASCGDCMTATMVMGWATGRTGVGQERCPETLFSQGKGRSAWGFAGTNCTRNFVGVGQRKEPLNPAQWLLEAPGTSLKAGHRAGP